MGEGEPKISAVYLKERDRLPEELWSVYEMMVRSYPFVSYKILASMVRGAPQKLDRFDLRFL